MRRRLITLLLAAATVFGIGVLAAPNASANTLYWSPVYRITLRSSDQLNDHIDWRYLINDSGSYRRVSEIEFSTHAQLHAFGVASVSVSEHYDLGDATCGAGAIYDYSPAYVGDRVEYPTINQDCNMAKTQSGHFVAHFGLSGPSPNSVYSTNPF